MAFESERLRLETSAGSFFLELTDRPVFPIAPEKVKNELRCRGNTAWGDVEMRCSFDKASKLARLEYSDDMVSKTERRIRLSGKDVEIQRPLDRVAILRAGSAALGMRLMMADPIAATFEDDYGITLKIEPAKRVAMVVFLARGRTVSQVRKALDSVYS